MLTEVKRESFSAVMYATRRRAAVDTGAMSDAVRSVLLIYQLRTQVHELC